jgi:chitinase
MLRLISAIGLLLAVTCNAQNLIAYDNGHDPAKEKLDRLTHLIYCFAHLDGGRMAFSAKDSNIIRSLKRNHPNLKILLSIGGWGGCSTCPQVFATETGRNHFAQSAKELLNALDADGIDIDWEFPMHAADLTALLKALHDTLGPRKELSFVAAAFAPYLQQSYEWPQIAPLVTRINLMTYDLIGSRSPITGHQAALYSSGPQVESADHAVKYLDSLKIPGNKIAIGAAFYAREWDHVPARDHGLFQKGHFVRFLTLAQIARQTGFHEYWDSTAQAAYSYNPNTKSFLSYDDKRSLIAKAHYVEQHGLDGIMFWELGLDTPQCDLLQTLYSALNWHRNFGTTKNEKP